MIPRATRIAREAPPGWNLVKTGVQIVFFWGFFLWLVPVLVARVQTAMNWDGVLGFPSRPWLGAMLFGFAGSTGFWRAGVMAWRGGGTPMPTDAPRKLVISGPYRWVRNPMALAGITQGVAVGLMLGSWSVCAYAICGALMWNAFVRPWEEADLAARFGEEFERYRAAVRCWLPRVRPYTAR